ncbi:predicted protein [Postia placenta Mad-698-R]|nr:predicted protein [Postia placenta Mad-698-R]
MSSTLSFLDQFNAPSTKGGKRLSIYTPKHTHVGDSTLLTLLLRNPTDVFNKLKAHNPEATNATDRAALEAYLSTRRDYDEAVKAADEAINHHKQLLRQQDDRVLTELIRLDNLKVTHRFQPLLPRSIRARHNKFIPLDGRQCAAQLGLPAPDKETLKLLLPLRYDGKTVIECNRFLSQLRIYWMVNTSLTTIELKVQVALSLLDGDARAWATPYFAQLASVQVGIQGATTPFGNEAAFAAAFKARFGNLDDEAAAQVELAKLCADKSVREKRTAAEFSALFKGPADRSGYGDLELRDKYLSGIPSRVYRKIELETFTTWQAAEKRTTEVEQILDISRAHRPELNNFFSTRG